MLHRIAFLLLCLLLYLPVAEGAAVWFLYDKENARHQEYVHESGRLLRLELPAVELRHIGLNDGLQLGLQPPAKTLLVSVGLKATQQAVASGLPTMSTLISRHNFESLRGQYKAPVSAIYLDQPSYRYLQLVSSALPEYRRLTVLQGQHSQHLAEELGLLAQQYGMELQRISLDDMAGIEELFSQRMQSGGPLLLLPDHEVVNQHTIKPLVLGSYRHGIPLIAYSQSLVKAGALMAVHSTVLGMEQQLVAAAAAFLATGHMAEPSYADDFAVSVNYQLARALRLSLLSEQKIKQAVKEHSR